MNSGAINIFSPAPQQKYQKLKQTKLQILATVANSLLDAKNMEEDISVQVVWDCEWPSYNLTFIVLLFM